MSVPIASIARIIAACRQRRHVHYVDEFSDKGAPDIVKRFNAVRRRALRRLAIGPTRVNVSVHSDEALRPSCRATDAAI